MCFSQIKKNLSNNIYLSFDEFEEDILLVFDNSIFFNGEFSYFGELANRFKSLYYDLK